MNLLSAGSFSAYLGYPRKAYFVPKKENTKETNFNCNSNSTPKKKSARKTEFDNLRAAKFQAKKVEESEQSAAAAVEASSPTAAVPALSPSTLPSAQAQHPLNF